MRVGPPPYFPTPPSSPVTRSVAGVCRGDTEAGWPFGRVRLDFGRLDGELEFSSGRGTIGLQRGDQGFRFFGGKAGVVQQLETVVPLITRQVVQICCRIASMGPNRSLGRLCRSRS